MTPTLNLNKVIRGAIGELPRGVHVERHTPASIRTETPARFFSFASGRWLEHLSYPSGEAKKRPLQDEWVFAVRNAVVTSDHVVYTEDGTRLENSGGWPFGQGLEHDFSMLRAHAAVLDDRVAFAGTKNGRMGEQWLLQVMPRAVRLRQLFGDVPIIAPPSHTSLQEPWRTAGVLPEKRITQPDAGGAGEVTAIRVRELLLTNQVVLASGISGARFDEVQTQFAGIRKIQDSPRHLFVARKANTRNSMKNTDQIAAIAANLGFTTIVAEDHSLEEKVALFAGARIVAGEAGTGLHPSIFSPPGQMVVEISPSQVARTNDIQRLITSYRGLNLGVISSQRAAQEQGWMADPEVVGLALESLVQRVS